jgi:hypothetical protein
MPVFGEQQKKGRTATPILNEIVGRVNDNTKRLRLLEQREKILTTRTSSMDESIGGKLEALENARKELDLKITALEEKVNTVNNTLKEVVKQLQFLAKRSEVKKIEETVKILQSLLPQAEPAQEQSKGG